MVTFGNMTQNQVQPNCQTFSTYNVALIDEFLEKDATITRFSAYITVTGICNSEKVTCMRMAFHFHIQDIIDRWTYNEYFSSHRIDICKL